MSTNLALRAAADINEIQQVARLLALSNYFDAKGNGETAIAQLATKILAGQELGYEPFASVNGIHIIQGKPSISGNLMATAVKRSARYDYRVRQMDDSAVTVEFFERINGRLESLGVSAFTAEDAKKAATQNMNKFPRNMLFNRAMSNGVRWYCPDVFQGNAVYTPDELGVAVNDDGEIVDAQYTVTSPAPATNGTGNGRSNGNAAPPVTPVPDNPFADEPDEIGQLLAGWQTPQDAYQWAIDIGACHAPQHARNAFEKVVKEHFGGKFKASNANAVYRAFVADRQRALAEKAEAEAEPAIDQPLTVDMKAQPEMPF